MTEAERLAEILEQTDQMHENADISSKETAAELRRLHAINAELVKTLEAIENNAGIEGMVGFQEWAKGSAHFAVKKAKQ
jgi:hypothetical protein